MCINKEEDKRTKEYIPTQLTTYGIVGCSANDVIIIARRVYIYIYIHGEFSQGIYRGTSTEPVCVCVCVIKSKMATDAGR